MTTPSPQGHVDYSGLELDTREGAAGRGIEVYNFEDHLQPARHNGEYSTLPEAAPQPFSHVGAGAGQDYPWAYNKNQHESPASKLSPTSSKTCGIPTRRFYIYLGVALGVAVIVLAVALGTYFGLHHHNGASKTSSTGPTSNINIAALHWVDVDDVGQYRVLLQVGNQSNILQSSSSDKQNWTVSTITNPNANIQSGTPLAAMVGYLNTNLDTLHEMVMYKSTAEDIVLRYYKQEYTLWVDDDGFSNSQAISNASSLFAYRYQNISTRFDWFFVLYQELGANSISIIRYKNNNGTNVVNFEASQKQISVQDGSPLAAAPLGSEQDVNLYVGNQDRFLTQYPYNYNTNVVGNPTTTQYEIDPHTPMCISIQDNTNYYTDATLPACTQADTSPFLTHLILFASQDRKNLTLLSWNCSSGFTSVQDRVAPLLQQGRTYLGLSAAANSNMSVTGQRVYVAYDDGSGVPAVEEWQVPDSGGMVDIAAQEAEWTLLGNVPLVSP